MHASPILKRILLLLLSSLFTINTIHSFVITKNTRTKNTLSNHVFLNVKHDALIQNNNKHNKYQRLFSIVDNNDEIVTTTKNSKSDTKNNVNIDGKEVNNNIESQIITAGYSNNNQLMDALEEATKKAFDNLPKGIKIDLAIINMSSLYDNQSVSYTKVVPTFLKILSSFNNNDSIDIDVKQIIGCTSGGIISSMLNTKALNNNDDTSEERYQNSLSVETEGLPGVSITLCILPDVDIDTFHITSNDLENKKDDKSLKDMLKLTNLQTKMGKEKEANDEKEEPYFLLFPSPSFSNNQLDELIEGIQSSYPSANNNNVLGAISSTVSSLSRARLFSYSSNSNSNTTTFTDGCVGVSLSGDILLHNFICQGAKAVSDTYTIIDGEDSSIKTIMSDKQSTPHRTRMPRPPLAEANYIMKTDLSDDEQKFMQKVLLIGVSSDNGNNFVVKQIASAGMKDGSVTFSLGSINIESGDKMKFYVRENSQFAKDEVVDTWDDYKSSFLNDEMKDFVPTGCLLYPTLDRGKSLFSSGGSSSSNKSTKKSTSTFESDIIRTCLPNIESVSGFFSNGVVGTVNGINDIDDDTTVIHGSGSSFILIGSKTKRPIYSAIKSKKNELNASKVPSADTTDINQEQEQTDNDNRKEEKESEAETISTGTAPRNPVNNELIIKRREIHSGRAISVSTVEWSVADKKVYPTSILEKFVWDKEFEIDNFRERVPLANVVSQCNNIDKFFPELVNTNDWVAAFTTAAGNDEQRPFIIIPECKRLEPKIGSLHKRYKVQNLVEQYISSNAKSISINVDQTLFGGNIDDMKLAKSVSNTIPILASDLVLYPYQLYRLRLAGADAIYFLVGALMKDHKDLFYLFRITKALKMQTVLSVATKAQIQILTDNVKQFQNNIDCLILSNRDLETFAIDESGAQVLDLANSAELKEFRNAFGEHVPILAEGGISVSVNSSIQQLKQTGIFSGAIVASGLLSAMTTSAAISDDSDDGSSSDDDNSANLNFIL